MASDSPAVILYDGLSHPLAVQNSTTIPASTPALLAAGSDGSNSRYILVDSTGKQIVVGAGIAGTPTGGVVSIQGVTSGTVVATSNLSLASNNSTAPTSSMQIGGTDGTNIQAAKIFNLNTGVGTTDYNLGISLRLPSGSGSVAGGTSSVPIRIDPTGTTIQPVSGSITVTQATGSNLNAVVSGTVTSNQGTGASLSNRWPVQITDGTNVMPTGDVVSRAVFQKVTDGTNTVTVTGSSALKVDGSAVTQPVSGTITANAGSGTFTVAGTVTSNIGTTNGLALDASINGILVTQGSSTSGEKGPLIQGAVTTSAPSYTTTQTSPLSLTTVGNLRVDGSSVTQPISGTVTSSINTGRTAKVFQVSAVAGVTSEAMLTLTPLTNFTAGSTGTSFTVTAGKKLRIQSFVATFKTTANTAIGGICRLRISDTGAVTTSTPVIASVGVSQTQLNNVSGNGFTDSIEFFDGIEISGTMQIGVSQLTTATSAAIDISVIGFEY